MIRVTKGCDPDYVVVADEPVRVEVVTESYGELYGVRVYREGEDEPVIVSNWDDGQHPERVFEA